VALSIIAVIFTSASVLDYSYILKRDVHHLQMDLSSRVLTAVAEQTINPQTPFSQLKFLLHAQAQELK
jgi:hypothetical protein